MRILHVIPYFTPKRGGDVNVCYMLSKHLVQRGHEVTILTTDFEFDKDYAKTLEDNGVRIILSHCVVNLKLFLVSPDMNKWLKKPLIKNYDIIHLHDFRSYQNKIIHHYALKFKIPYALQAHGDIPINIEKQSLKRLYDFFWGKKILEDVSKVIALTNTEKEQYIEIGVNSKKIVIIPNGIDLTEYTNLPERGKFRRENSIGNDEKIILYVGRLHKSKGIDLLIGAVSDIIQKSNDVKLLLVGPDMGYRSELEKIIKSLNIEDKVLFTGFISNNEKISALIDSDVFVTPSFSGFPITFLEACACKIPIITTNNGDKLDWIHNVGYSVEYNKEHLKNAIIGILNDVELRKKLGANGIALINEKFSWEAIIKELENMYVSMQLNQLTYKDQSSK